MPLELSWFAVRLALAGISEERSSQAVQGLQDELNMRPHLRNSQVSWEAKTCRAIIQVDAEGLNSESVAKQMAEEMFEVACAVLWEIDGMHVEILDAHSSSC